MSLRELVLASLRQDARMLAISCRSLSWRSHYLATKYVTIAQLLWSTPTFSVDGNAMSVLDVGELGTMQSNITDFYETVVMADVLGEAPLVVDVGANIGQFARSVKVFYPDATVISYEPDPAVYSRLQENIAGLDRMYAHNIGLGDSEGPTNFFKHELSVMSTFSPDSGDSYSVENTSSLMIRRLDGTLDANLHPDLLKIDVEGFELEVLKGGWETVRRCRYLLVELSLGRDAGKDNLRLLSAILDASPAATIVRFGRALGHRARPACQDVLIAVNGEGNDSSLTQSRADHASAAWTAEAVDASAVETREEKQRTD